MSKRILILSTALFLLPFPVFAQLRFEPDLNQGLNFPDTPPGQRSVRELTVIGNPPNDVQQQVMILIEGQLFSANPQQFVIDAEARVAVAITFAPQQAGNVETRMVVVCLTADGRMLTYECRLTGRCVAGDPEIEVAPDELDFFIDTQMERIVGELEDTLIISNVGEADLVVSDITADVDWLDIDGQQFTVRPNQRRIVPVSIPPEAVFGLRIGVHRATLTVVSNDPENGEMEVPVRFDRGELPPTHFRLIILNPPENNHSLLIRNVFINGEAAEPGDEVGVFTPYGNLAGAGVVTEEMPMGIAAYGIDEHWELFFDDGDRFDFRTWDRSAEREAPAVPRWIQGPQVFDSNGFSVLELFSGGVIQRIILTRGWNMISLNIEPGEQYLVNGRPSVQRILAGVVDNVLTIKDGLGRFAVPRLNFWELRDWNIADGYQIKTTQVCTLTVIGEPIPFDRPVELRAGWNLVAYYPLIEQRGHIAMNDLLQRNLLLIAKDAQGHFMIRWWWDVFWCRPGQGYQIKVTENCQFRWARQQ
ncbi:MAG: hypothetical protein FJY65_05405 [Calditrichaeota bacterium]|nr:hypothetical protein [Calditrichota bacterium]